MGTHNTKPVKVKTFSLKSNVVKLKNLYPTGLSNRKIAKEIGCSEASIRGQIKKLKLAR